MLKFAVDLAEIPQTTADISEHLPKNQTIHQKFITSSGEPEVRASVAGGGDAGVPEREHGEHEPREAHVHGAEVAAGPVPCGLDRRTGLLAGCSSPQIPK